VEASTNAMEEAAERYFAAIQEMGRGSILEGVLAGIERGYFQREIADAAYAEQTRYEKGRLVKVGVTDFVTDDEALIDTLVIPPETEGRQVDRVRAMKASRDGAAAAGALERLTAAAGGDDNLIPFLVDCARAYCTEGEIVDALRGVFGGYQEVPQF
jgi:methylmalonyl-CoA mutase N-terminal domain/subunit